MKKRTRKRVIDEGRACSLDLIEFTSFPSSLKTYHLLQHSAAKNKSEVTGLARWDLWKSHSRLAAGANASLRHCTAAKHRCTAAKHDCPERKNES